MMSGFNSKPSFVEKPDGLSKGELAKKLFLEHATNPWTLFPFLIGVTDLSLLWAFGISSGIALFAGITCILGATGAFFTRILLSGERVNTKIFQEIEKAAEEKRNKALDDLERKLVEDRDPRTENCLRDLRTLARSFQNCKTWAASMDAHSVFEITGGVDKLFHQCVGSLEKSLALWYIANDLATPDARRPILIRRNQIIKDVGESIKHLGSILAGMQSMGITEGAEHSELARIRHELEQSLEVACNIEKRMHSLNSELDLTNYSNADPHQKK